MLISIRGTSGSGKSTIVRTILERFKGRPIYGCLGPKNPEAYVMQIPKVKKPVYALGPYQMVSGGCDQIRPYDNVLNLINKYGKDNVVFEGMVVSASLGRVGKLMADGWGKQAVFAVMTTPLETCIANVQSRRNERGDAKAYDPKHLVSRYNDVLRSRKLAEEGGVLRVEELTMQTGVERVIALLREAA